MNGCSSKNLVENSSKKVLVCRFHYRHLGLAKNGQQAPKCSEGHLLTVAACETMFGDTQDVESENNERLVQHRRRTPS